jgi:ClpP class serine protease
MFKEMTDKERQVWQDMVNHAYILFLDVVEKGRPELKGKLVERFPVKPLRVGPADERDKQSDKVYYRYLADGGIFTADLALEKKLIDQVGDVEDAIKQARKEAGLDDNSKVIQYEKFKTLSEQLLGVRAKNPGAWLEPAMLRNTLSPRLWYLAPGHELAGLLAACEAE